MKLINLLIAANLLLLLLLGTRLIFKFPIWSPIDERLHFGYIQFIAENKRLPTLEDHISWQVMSISEGAYPERTDTDPITIGEAFQPPLYYLISLPAYLFSGGNFYHKIFALRAQGFVVLLVTLILCWKFAAKLFADERKKAIFRTASIFIFLMPGILLRNVTLTNAALELVLAALFFYFLVIKEHMEGSAVVLGLLLLSRFTSIFLYGVFGLALAAEIITELLGQRSLRLSQLTKSLLPALIPLIMIAPWLYFNYTNYGSLTANSLAKEGQKQYINPDDKDYKLPDLIPMTEKLMTTSILPEEWGTPTNPLTQWGTEFFKVLLFFLALPISAMLVLAGAVAERRKSLLTIWGKHKRLIICVFWVFLNILMLYVVTIKEDWPLRIGRYLYISIPPLIYLVTGAVDFLFKEKRQLYFLLLSETFIVILWTGITLAFLIPGIIF